VPVTSRWKPATSPVYAVLLSGLVIAGIGGLGVWAGQPWLFPSLGPTIFLQAVTPNDTSARPWNTVAGHAIGTAAGFLSVFVCGAEVAPLPADAGYVVGSRAAAAALAVALTVAGQLAIRAPHAPAAATTMLIALGGLQPDLRTLVAIAVGVGLIAGLGEVTRLRHPERSR
jgi:hypothetical protein